MKTRLNTKVGLRSAFSRSLKALAPIALLTVAACSDPAPETAGAQPDMRRLTEEQYRNVIHDVFGNHIEIAGRFDPLVRSEGLLAVGARSAPITPAGFEQFYNVARSVANLVISEDNRLVLMPCEPADTSRADDACAEQVLSGVGRLLYRRALTDSELATAVEAAHTVSSELGDFYQGIAFGLANMLVTPSFLFNIDTIEPDPDNRDGVRLTGYAKASRLSFLLWNTAPDDMLLRAAESGALHTEKGMEEQVERLLASPLLERGIRAFFADFLDLEKYETLEKDTLIYPAYSLQAAESSKEQLLRTIVDHVVHRDEPYPQLFTTRKTFIDASLGRVYRIPVTRPDGGWEPYEFPEDDNRAGILTQMGFLSLYSHPGRSSATLRGQAVRELVLCQKVPDPPSNIDFTLFNDPNAPSRTARERLIAHSTVPSCEGCHKITDPIGLGFEQFDGIGQFRTTERGAVIDPTGDVDGIPFDDARGFANALESHPGVPACLANQLYTYAVGRPTTRDEREFMRFLEAGFAEDGFHITALLRSIALSDALYAMVKPSETVRAASLSNPSAEKERGS